MAIRPPALPPLVDRKIYKTGQTRGADDGEIYQNRVGRNSTVLIRHAHWEVCATPDDGSGAYENGFIVLVSPQWYFNEAGAQEKLARRGLAIRQNTLVFYQSRHDWITYSPQALGWTPATRRLGPDLGGEFVARIAGITARAGDKIRHGFTTTAGKGAGIRVYEYASSANLAATRLQLEALMWRCGDAVQILAATGMGAGAEVRSKAILERAATAGMLQDDLLYQNRLVDDAGLTVCPLCLENLSASLFSARIAQAEGRETHDTTITEVSLFHVNELRVGTLQHKTYNLGWGHHHCNVVAKDAGIAPTIDWLRAIIERNDRLRAD